MPSGEQIFDDLLRRAHPRGAGEDGRDLLQQNASRTRCRADAPSALERARQAARSEEVAALLHHICNLETLRMAYFAIKRGPRLA
jgi:hypothetical protein